MLGNQPHLYNPNVLNSRICLFQCVIALICKQTIYDLEDKNFSYGLCMLYFNLCVLHFSSLSIQPLDLFSEYCLEQGIPFPSTELSQEDREHLKECYVFKDSLEAPILVYFPLVCDTFQKYKAPSKLTALIFFFFLFFFKKNFFLRLFHPNYPLN